MKNPTVSRWSVNDNILNNYETLNPLIIVARCIYCITMALTYPCSFFVVRHVCYAMGTFVNDLGIVSAVILAFVLPTMC